MMAETYHYTPKQVGKLTMYQIQFLGCNMTCLPGLQKVSEDELAEVKRRSDRNKRSASRGLSKWD